MIEWLITGGGIHGTYLSNLLTAETDLTRDDVRVLDPHDRPLELWNRYARNCGMRYLRSPATHNIDIHILSLYRFAKSNGESDGAAFIPPYNRPSLKLFRRHCEAVIRHRGLSDMRVKGRATALIRLAGGIAVDTGSDRIRARRVLLCAGQTENPCWPEWALKARNHGAAISHVFSKEYQEAGPSRGERAVVVGGGLAAVQTALAIAGSAGAPVTILSPHNLRQSNFDFDPCWIGPKCMTRFLWAGTEHRRELIDMARKPGTLPLEVFSEVTGAIQGGRIIYRKAAALGLKGGNGPHRVTLDGDDIEADRVVLATGFNPNRPGGPLVDQASREFSLRTTQEGYPVVDNDLQWGSNIFVSGPLAELRIGPCARNIVGARNAGRLLLTYVKNRRRPRF